MKIPISDLKRAISEGITAYHGSPHLFDKFDMSKIGTGEGAQAFGHGLYFAGNEEVAKGYRDVLTSANGGAVRGTDDSIGRQAERVRRLIQRTLAYPRRDSAMERLPAFEARLADLESMGHLYQVNLDVDPSHLLDWDKPLSQQGAGVQKTFAPLLYGENGGQLYTRRVGDDLTDIYSHAGGGGSFGIFPTKDLPADLSELAVKHDPRPGALLYESKKLVPGEYRDPAAAAKALKERGVPGLQYLDAGSRTTGEGTRNYVMFDPEKIKIIRRYGLAGLAGMEALRRAMAAQMSGDQAETVT